MSKFKKQEAFNRTIADAASALSATSEDAYRELDHHYLDLARDLATHSKDPSTKVGAVLVSAEGRILGTGFNRFPHGEPDGDELYADRTYKYKHIRHAEEIAMSGRDCTGATIYTSFPCCPECMRRIRLAGIRRVVCHPLDEKGRSEDWIAQWRGWVSESVFIAAGDGIEFVMRWKRDEL